jgi:agmatinase
VNAAEIAREPDDSARKIAAQLSGKKVHISFDIDALDPAFAPGTEIPSAGGLSTRQALELLKAATVGVEVVGLDVVEVSPPADNSDVTTLAALKIIFETWGRARGNR